MVLSISSCPVFTLWGECGSYFSGQVVSSQMGTNSFCCPLGEGRKECFEGLQDRGLGPEEGGHQ